MASFTFSLTSNVISGSKSYTLSDGDVTRWINTMKVSVPDGNSMSNGQLLLAWANNVMDRLKGQVRNVETQAAAEAASANVVDIAVTY